jgi:hypothetical protein
LDTQDALNEVVPETEDGGNGAFVEPGDPSRASRRAWAFLAVLFWFEAAWAASFFGWTIAYWAAYPSAFAPHFILSVEHMVRITDTPRMALYLAFIGLAATLLAGTGFLVWRSRSSPRATFDFAVGRGVLWAQPLLVVLVIDTGIAVAYNWDMNGLTASFPAFSIPVFVGMIVFATVFLLSLARALSTTRWLVSAGATVVIVATVLVPLFAVGGYFGVEGSFSSIDALPTGQHTCARRRLSLPASLCGGRLELDSLWYPPAIPDRGSCDWAEDEVEGDNVSAGPEPFGRQAES